MPCIARRHDPLVLRGTLTTFRRRCGKPTCRCASGEPHESPALLYNEGGRTNPHRAVSTITSQGTSQKAEGLRS
jgi:hypothetical protein